MAVRFVPDVRPTEKPQNQTTAEEPSEIKEEPQQAPQAEPERGVSNNNEDKKKSETVVVIAGRPSSGKSTALNNLFGVEFNKEDSVKSVTSHVEYKKVTKQGSTVIVVDTPGLEAADLQTDEIEKEFASIVGDLNCTLLYCYSVAPCTKMMEADLMIFKKLQKVLGQQIWKKCIILFTFSDTLRREKYAKIHKRGEYISRLQEHAKYLTEMLQERCGDHVPTVKLVTDITVDDEAEVKEIVAVPIGVSVTQKREWQVLIPKPDKTGINWCVVAWKEILRKLSKLDQIVLNKTILTKANMQIFLGLAVSIVVGATLGGLGGAVVGAAAVGFGSVPGAVAGAVIGGVTTAIGSGSVAIVGPHANETTKEAKINKLRSAPLEILDDNNQPQPEVVQPNELESSSYPSSTDTSSLPSEEVRKRAKKRKEYPNRIYHKYEEPSPQPSPAPPVVDSEVPDNDGSQRLRRKH